VLHKEGCGVGEQHAGSVGLEVHTESRAPSPEAGGRGKQWRGAGKGRGTILILDFSFRTVSNDQVPTWSEPLPSILSDWIK
jgi:hypothetical protein